MGIGFCILLCGVLFFLVPRDAYGTVIELAIAFLVVGALLMWLGSLAHQ